MPAPHGQLDLWLPPDAEVSLRFLGRAPAWSRVPLDRVTLRQRADELVAFGSPALRLRSLAIHVRRRVDVRLDPSGQHRGVSEATMHWALLLEPERTARALAAAAARSRFPPWTAELLDELARRDDVRRSLPSRRLMRLAPQGRFTDLRPLFQEGIGLLPELNGHSPLRIGWGRRPPAGPRRRAIRLGSARLTENSIVIHPALDDPGVPLWVTGQVVFHELCHFAAPPLDEVTASVAGEHRLHHRAFRALEERYPRLDDARRWIADNLTFLLSR
ncbi:MAG: hypothetical protein EA398_07900 [Deltaproteobacteria bacterium]|nr:MAG: hypothetical protein EA398_07900 [Deltaproteobacteria bacterium]